MSALSAAVRASGRHHVAQPEGARSTIAAHHEATSEVDRPPAHVAPHVEMSSITDDGRADGALFGLAASTDSQGVAWSIGGPADINPLLSREHYLGPLTSGGHSLIVIGTKGAAVVAGQVWRRPTSRSLPADGTWLELSRWCLTPAAGDNAGSRMHRWAARLIREHLPAVTTLVSYSDPSHGHDGALYRACNWAWRPTWHRLRPPPTGNGAWVVGETQSIKDRWVFPLRPDATRESVTHIDDPGAIRHWLSVATAVERRWARTHPQLSEETA